MPAIFLRSQKPLVSNVSSLCRAFRSSAARKSEIKLPLCASGFNPAFQDKVGFTDHQGRNFTYKELGGKSLKIAEELKSVAGTEPTRISFLTPHDSSFPITLWGSWLAGHAGE